jgi:hypothetical protein
MTPEGTHDLIPPLVPELGVHVVFLSVARKDEIFVRVVLECHEGFGVARAHEGEHEPERTLLSLLIVPDFAEPARALLADLRVSADIRFLEGGPDWIAQVMRDLP